MPPARAQEHKAQGARVPEHHAWRSFLITYATPGIQQSSLFILLLWVPHATSCYALASHFPLPAHKTQQSNSLRQGGIYRLVQVKRRKCIPRPKSTPFFRVRPWNFAHVFYEPLRRPDLTSPYEDLTSSFVFFICIILSSVKIFSEIWTSSRPSLFGDKKKKKTRRSGLGMDI